ncbi:MAG: hypothetical protein WB510_14630 [Candidatus Sulfotelmatobacter sp.]
MKRYLGIAIISLFLFVPALLAQDQTDHVEVGAFADYFRFAQSSPQVNFAGLGGRVGFNVHPSVQLEAEMAYDFQRSFTSTFNDGLATELFTTKFRTLHGLFGPKFQTGSGPVRLFVTGKVGVDNFSVNNQSAVSGFTNSVGLTNGTTDFAVYPNGGIEIFAKWIGVRAEVGDEIYFDHGGHNNLKVTFGPQIRFQKLSDNAQMGPTSNSQPMTVRRNDTTQILKQLACVGCPKGPGEPSIHRA